MPGPRVIEQDNYEVALKLAREKWRRLPPEVQARRCGAGCASIDGETAVTLPFLYRDYEVTHPDGEVFFAGRASQPALWERILLLHYLTSGGPVSDSQKMMAYGEMPDGKFYDAAYRKRTRNGLLEVFGERPELFAEAAKAIGAEPVAMGDLAFKVHAFPKVCLYVVMWRGDEELPPDASVLLEERIEGFLDAEDIAVLGGMAVGLLVKAARKIADC